MACPSGQTLKFVAREEAMGMSNDNDRKERILQLMRESDSPLSIKQVSDGVLGSSGKKQIELIQNDLLDLKSSGQVFEFPPERVKGSIRFGHVSPANWLGPRIVDTVKAAGGRLTPKQVRGSLRQWETAYFDEAVGKLVKDGKLFYLTVRYKFLLSSAPEPFDHLLPRQVTALREILERVNRRRKKTVSLDELRAFLNGSDRSEVSAVEQSGKPTEELLREWYHEDLPRRGGLTSIPIPWTWARYESWCLSHSLKPDLSQLQDFMQGLYRDGKIEFVAHSMTQELSERELELSLRSQYGEILYYWKWR
jgi:hypothetical protein